MRQRRVFGPSWVFHHPKLQIASMVCALGLFVIGIPGLVDNTEVWLKWLGKPTGTDGMTTAHWISLSLAFVLFVGVNVVPVVIDSIRRAKSKKQEVAIDRLGEELREIELLLDRADYVRSVSDVDKRIEVEGWRVEASARFEKIGQLVMAKNFLPCSRFSKDDYLDWACTLLRGRQLALIGRIRAYADPSNQKQQRTEEEQDQDEKFDLELEIKPRDGHLQVTAKVVNRNPFSIHIERVEFYFPPAQTITMKHGDSRGGEVKSKAALPFHYITWDAGSAEDVRLISPNELKIEATTATGATQAINGEQIKAATLELLNAVTNRNDE